MTTLIQFAYETGDRSEGCQYWQDFSIVKSDLPIDFAEFADGIASYMESDLPEDKAYEEMTEEIMNVSGYTWYFLNSEAVSINATYTFWI